ncbi:hypothetical protein SteCoe_13946 [Stentor coeruleus]|uniref:Arf-GAP domain-containing protein n=1 Tax=Stentor coeruleus TaxID=5963 RepID=A0A1R2C7H1_9CILI|nr:hypothetical protein SteCoe_13946 [Stentor coeruleus]
MKKGVDTSGDIAELRKIPANKRCFDCNQAGTTYAVPELGIFLCSICGGIHREFNHRVKGLSTCNFSEAEVSKLKSMGNEKALLIWMARHDPRGFPIPDLKDSNKLKDFLRLKYVEKRFYENRETPAQAQPEPPKITEKKIEKPPTSGFINLLEDDPTNIPIQKSPNDSSFTFTQGPQGNNNFFPTNFTSPPQNPNTNLFSSPTGQFPPNTQYPPPSTNTSYFPPSNNTTQFFPIGDDKQFMPTNTPQFPSVNPLSQYPQANPLSQFNTSNPIQQFPPSNNPPQFQSSNPGPQFSSSNPVQKFPPSNPSQYPPTNPIQQFPLSNPSQYPPTNPVQQFLPSNSTPQFPSVNPIQQFSQSNPPPQYQPVNPSPQFSQANPPSQFSNIPQNNPSSQYSNPNPGNFGQNNSNQGTNLFSNPSVIPQNSYTPTTIPKTQNNSVSPILGSSNNPPNPQAFSISSIFSPLTPNNPQSNPQNFSSNLPNTFGQNFNNPSGYQQNYPQNPPPGSTSGTVSGYNQNLSNYDYPQGLPAQNLSPPIVANSNQMFFSKALDPFEQIIEEEREKKLMAQVKQISHNQAQNIMMQQYTVQAQLYQKNYGVPYPYTFQQWIAINNPSAPQESRPHSKNPFDMFA